MPTLDRYLLSQLLTLFGFFSLVLVAVYWVNRAVSLFDTLIAGGHSATTFLEFSVLALPNVIRIVLPVSAFAATVYITNRMRGDSEMVVVQSTGASPARAARPVVVFGIIAATVTLILTHVLTPMSTGRLDQRASEIAQDVTAGLVTEGQFLHPADGVTIFIGDITPEGELRALFLSDRRRADERTTYTAARALLLRRDDGPRLVMFDGQSQVLDVETGRLGTTRFDEFVFDISALIDTEAETSERLEQIISPRLVLDRAAVLERTGETSDALTMELAERTTQGVQALVAPILGFAVMMLGGFSRFAAWRQIIGAVVSLIVFDLADNMAFDLVAGRGALWPLLFVPSALALAAAGVALRVAGAPMRRRRTAAAT